MRVSSVIAVFWPVLLTLLAGCGSNAAPPDPPGRPASGLRVVSLSPAITQTLVDLGFEEDIVGRSAYCQAVDSSVPVVGDLYELDYEILIRLQPTHVLVQPPSARGLDRHLLRIAGERGWTLGTWTINTVDDVRELIDALPLMLFRENDPRMAAITSRAGLLRQRIDDVLRTPPRGAWHGPTLLVASVDPVLVFGRSTYLADVLVALGAENAASVAGWGELSLEDVVRLDPAAVIIVTDRAADIGLDPLVAAGQIGALDIAAVADGRVRVLHHPQINLPCSRVAEVAIALREVLVDLATPSP